MICQDSSQVNFSTADGTEVGQFHPHKRRTDSFEDDDIIEYERVLPFRMLFHVLVFLYILVELPIFIICYLVCAYVFCDWELSNCYIYMLLGISKTTTAYLSPLPPTFGKVETNRLPYSWEEGNLDTSYFYIGRVLYSLHIFGYLLLFSAFCVILSLWSGVALREPNVVNLKFISYVLQVSDDDNVSWLTCPITFFLTFSLLNMSSETFFNFHFPSSVHVCCVFYNYGA